MLVSQGLTWDEANIICYEEMRLLIMQASYKREVDMLNQQILVLQQKEPQNKKGAKELKGEMRKLTNKIYAAEDQFYGKVK